MRGLPGGVPGEDQHPAHADWPARTATRAQAGSLGSARVPGVDGGAATAVAVSVGPALCPAGVAAVGPRRLAAAAAGAGGGLDGGARFSGAGGTVVSREVEGLVKRD